MLRGAWGASGPSHHQPTIEAWGGAECTVNRVGNVFRDQLVETGHHARVEDFDRLAELGLAAVRFPILWERVSPRAGLPPDWTWTDDRLARLARLGIRPIAGLVHHGSGPAHTSLLDDGFARGLAAYAARVAERYPTIRDWTPVNEPLTTARFSALYGLWYPHATDERAFWLALLNQVDATVRSMRAIRAINPAARLIQTEDLGRTYATAGLVGQAGFDNQRRWMTWDLLCGTVTSAHPLWRRLCDFGFEPRLRALAAAPCPPDVIGINHYLTSDRLLDERIGSYPEGTHGGNGTQVYSDVEAVRVLDPAPQGLAGAIGETWARYRRPIALTEVHNACTREEQARWLAEAWMTAHDACSRGIDVRAVTAWSLFGCQGWNTLLTEAGEYEAGAFDATTGTPRATAIATTIRQRGAGTSGTPWWRRAVRLHYPARPRPAPMAEHAAMRPREPGQPLLILGATGTLGRMLAAECAHRDLHHVALLRADLDLLAPEGIAALLDRYRPWAVVNAAGWVRVDDAEDSPEACHAANATGAIAVAEACARAGVANLGFSSDLVFDGQSNTPYRESDTPSPLGVYGRSKAAMEARLGELDALVIRTAAFFSPFDPHNFAIHCTGALARGERFAAAADHVVSPTYVPDLCRAALDLLIDRERGVWHLTNGEGLSWHAFALRLAQALGLDDGLLDAVPGADLGWRAPRPGNAALASERGARMPSLDSAITRFAAQQSQRRAA